MASTPDSTPPCTDGGNEESELYELQTAREWSEDDEGADGDDEDGLASSPSLWGTPRQHSYELTFSYIAIAEPEAVGASRHLRERRRGASRSSRTALFRTDTLETLLDSPDVEWDPQSFLTQEGQEAAAESRQRDSYPSRTDTEWTGFDGDNYEPIEHGSTQLSQEQETQERDTGLQRDETLCSFSVQTSTPSQSTTQYYPTHTVHASTSPSPEPASPASRETISVKLLTSVPTRGTQAGDPTSSSATGLKSQEQLVSEHWFSALGLAESETLWTHIAALDLIYWKDTERSGMVLTGLVVGLLSLFQLNIISVLSTVSLAVMCCTISVRIYYQVLYILSWGDGVHPFKSYLDMDISLSGELADQFMQKAIVTTLSVMDALKRLYFVGNLFNSLKFLLLLYLVTFVGKLCNGLTLLIISVIALFSLPLFYQRHQAQVDSLFAKVQGHYDNITDILLRLSHGGSPPPDQTPGGAKPKAQ